MSKNYEMEELLSVIRKIDESVSLIKVKNAKIDKNSKSVEVRFINNSSVSESVCDLIKKVLISFLPSEFHNVKVTVNKVKADKDLVEQMLYDRFITNRKYFSGVIKREDFVFKKDVCELEIALSDNEAEMFKNGRIFDSLKEFLDDNFCEDIKITAVLREEREVASVKEEADFSDFEQIKVRTITVNNVRSYMSYDEGDTAIYIADALSMRSELTVCGIVTEVRKLTTSKGKDMFLISFTDKTDRLTGKYFPLKDKSKFIEALKEGDALIMKGEMSEYNGKPDFKINNIGRCDFPEDFVPERKPAKKAPARYKKICPSEIKDYSQMNMFKQNVTPSACLMGKTFVVLDVETTGLDMINDRITEIGAVKIVDGVITDCFTTLINPQVKISQRITDLTGIDNEMVKDKPTFKEVSGDFYKYIDGAVLVAHNASFDMGMIKNHFERENYCVENNYYDTLEMSRNTLKGLKNYQLNTVCGYFGIEFLHHRAMSDAHATAKLFIELINLKKCLPI